MRSRQTVPFPSKCVCVAVYLWAMHDCDVASASWEYHLMYKCVLYLNEKNKSFEGQVMNRCFYSEDKCHPFPGSRRLSPDSRPERRPNNIYMTGCCSSLFDFFFKIGRLFVPQLFECLQLASTLFSVSPMMAFLYFCTLALSSQMFSFVLSNVTVDLGWELQIHSLKHFHGKLHLGDTWSTHAALLLLREWQLRNTVS